MITAASQVRRYLKLAVGNEKTSQFSAKSLCLVVDLERRVAVKGQVRTNSRGGGQTCQIGKRGDPGKGGKMPIPVSLLEFSISRGTNKNKLGIQQPPRRTLPQRGAQPQAPEARAGRLRRSPRRRHTKSQNGCPKEARTAQLVRVGEPASAGKGKENSRKSCG